VAGFAAAISSEAKQQRRKRRVENGNHGLQQIY
jgi:hypothetical protein